MSGPTIRIGGATSFPDVTIASDMGSTLDITNINDFDLGLLGNQRKISGTPPRASSPGGELRDVTDSGGIEFVNLEDTNVTYDVRPPVYNGASDTIKIVRDNAMMSPPKPIEPTLTLNAPSVPSAQRPMQISPTSAAAASAPAPAAQSTWFSSAAPAAAPAAAPSGGGGIFQKLFGGGGSSAPAAPAVEETAYLQQSYLSPEQEAIKKSEGLTMLERMDRKGIGGTKMTVANSLEEINAELARRKDSKGLEASIRFQRSMLTTVTSGMEFLNNRYDPFGFAIDGWSEQVNENIEDYDEIFEELYDKYKDKSKVAPEVRLIMSLGLSAAMCHVTNTMFKSRMPGMDDILRNNPDLARQMAQAAAAQAVGPGFANFVSMAAPSRSGNAGGSAPGPRSAPAPHPMEEEPEMSYAPTGMGIGSPVPSADPRDHVGSAPATARREMRGPTGVDDILRTLNAAGDMPQRSVPQTSAIDSDDLNSVTSGMTTETMRRNGIARRRKTTPSQPTGATLTLNV